MNIISSDKAPAVFGPYSMAIEANGFIYTSGQLGIDPVTNKLCETVGEQVNQIFKNITAVLEAAGSDLNHVVKTTVFLQNMSDFAIFNELYAKNFGVHRPARSTVEVAKLPAQALVEIELIAVKV